MSLYDTVRFWVSGGRINHIRHLYDLIRPQTCAGLRKIRCGNSGSDSGYVMVDDFQGIQAALSLGIGTDISWDIEMTQRGVDVYQYDHTVEPPAECASNARLHFYKCGISGRTDSALIFRTIDEILSAEMAGYKGDLILKIDIEGCEWDVFEHMSDATLSRFRQICIEIHNPLARPTQRARRQRNIAVMEKLSRRFAPVHLHANNAGPVRYFFGLGVPKLLEINYLRRDGQMFSNSTETYPGELDAPNVPSEPEIEIGAMVACKTRD